MSVKRSAQKNANPFGRVQSLANIERVNRGALDGQDKRVQRVMVHICGSFDAISLSKLICKQFKVAHDNLVWDVAQRITELHCNCKGYSDGTIAELLEHVLTREPLPLNERVLHDLPRYHHKDTLDFYFVLQPHSFGLSLLCFVDEMCCRVPVPEGVTMRSEGVTMKDQDGCFIFTWVARYELRYNRNTLLTLEPQCSRVISDSVCEC